MRKQAKRGRAGPGLLQGNILQMIAHEFANPRAAIDMRNDLQNEVRDLHPFLDAVVLDIPVLVAHGAAGAEYRAIMQRADQHVALDLDLRLGELLRKAPELAAAGNRRIVVEI